MNSVQTIRAPEWRISTWLNTQSSIDLEAQRGRAVVACAFQMLCPGCVAQAIRQLKAINELISPQGMLVVGIHSVFQHHEAMTIIALRAFMHEYQITFPVGVDLSSPNGIPIPQTMTVCRMQGTPTLMLIDQAGNRRKQLFGHISDLELGVEIMRLVVGDEHETQLSGR